MFPISSRHNPAVQRVKKLHQKKYRDREKVFILEGTRALREVIHTDYPVDSLFYCPGLRDPKEQILVQFLTKKAKQTFMVDEQIMDYMSTCQTSQKVLAVLPQKNYGEEDFHKDSFFVALETISDPGNLGTVIRSAQAFNCGGIILLGDCVEWHNPKTVRASAGYILDVPHIRFSSPDSFVDFLLKKNLQLWSFSPDGDSHFNTEEIRSQLSFLPGFDSHTKLHRRETIERGVVLLFGNEGWGIQDNLKNLHHPNLCHKRFKIPMEKNVESLNLSVSVSIALHNLYSSSK